jgi:hypothetical protein
MGVLTVILATLSIICMGLGLVNILQISSEPIFSANLTWSFWMAMAGFLMLCTIALLLLGRGRISGD